MVNDQEPRYRLVDADGNVVGSLFAEPDGTLKLQEGTSGNDNELSIDTQGTLGVEQFALGDSQPRYRHITTVGGTSGTYQITLPETLEGADRTEVQISVFYDSGSNATPLLLRLNGDGSSTGNYQTTTEDGTTVTGQNAIRLAEANSNFQAVSGEIRVGQVFTQAVRCELARRVGKGAVAVSGARDVGVEDLTSIEFVPDGTHKEFRAAAWFRDV